MTPTPSSSSRDIERLSKYVRFPIQPTGVSWEIVPLSDPELLGPTDALLFAILTFDAPSLDSFMDQALPLNKAQDLFIKPQWVREWFSQNLKDKISVSSASGYLTINLIGYKADPFLNSSSAFSQGYYVRIDDKSLLLSLSGK